MWVYWDAPPGHVSATGAPGSDRLLAVPMLATARATASPGPVPRDGPAGPPPPPRHRPNQDHLLRRLQFPTSRDRLHCDQCLIVTFMSTMIRTSTMCRPPARACSRPQRREAALA